MSQAKKRFCGLFCNFVQGHGDDSKCVHQQAKQGLFGAVAQRALSRLFLQLLGVHAPLRGDCKPVQLGDSSLSAACLAQWFARGKARIDQLGRRFPVFAGGLLAVQYPEVGRCEI